MPAGARDFALESIGLFNEDDEDSVALVMGWCVASILEINILDIICCRAEVYHARKSPQSNCQPMAHPPLPEMPCQD